ncbi:MAG: sigma-70 family RNA polymerase sigma factor [Ruminococcaceae bacterium]|nr:sigma-70 family RNA polymerase sigma factor [Oscillospiraceae bacterium]
MTDDKIVELYWERSERAISETENKYGKYCYSIAYNILKNHEDTSECVNDTYFKVWNSIPDARPNKLSAFLGRITRNTALNMCEVYSAKKRGGNEIDIALDELLECVSGETEGDNVEMMYLRDVLNSFIEKLSDESRNIFVCRYWYMYSSKEIAEKYDLTITKVDVALHRARKKLKDILIKEGLY